MRSKIYAKLEMHNPTGSVKDRTALGLVTALEKDNVIKENSVLITATSGNLGISLAFICNQKGYKCIIVMPENMSEERKLMIRKYNASLILSPKEEGMQGAINKAYSLVNNNSNLIYIDQFTNYANVEAHYITGKEIIETLPDINIFISSIGSGGTITGVSKTLKTINNEITTIGIEPKSSPLISKGICGKHKIQGIGANFIPKILDLNYIDEIDLVSDDDAFYYMNELNDLENIPCGISSGANLCIAIKQAKKQVNKKIVIILPDSNNRYLSIK